MTDIPPVDLSQAPLSDVYKRLECDGNGLTTSEATRRLEQSTHHSVHNRKRQPRIITQVYSPASEYAQSFINLVPELPMEPRLLDAGSERTWLACPLKWSTPAP
jgi:hypothetical protein